MASGNPPISRFPCHGGVTDVTDVLFHTFAPAGRNFWHFGHAKSRFPTFFAPTLGCCGAAGRGFPLACSLRRRSSGGCTRWRRWRRRTCRLLALAHLRGSGRRWGGRRRGASSHGTRRATLLACSGPSIADTCSGSSPPSPLKSQRRESAPVICMSVGVSSVSAGLSGDDRLAKNCSNAALQLPFHLDGFGPRL